MFAALGPVIIANGCGFVNKGGRCLTGRSLKRTCSGSREQRNSTSDRYLQPLANSN